MARQSSASFDEHERPTAPRPRTASDADANATTRMKPFDLDQLVQKGSGTRPVVTAEQIDRHMRERTAAMVSQVPGHIDAPIIEIDKRAETATESARERATLPAPPEPTSNGKTSNDKTSELDIRERETIDALTLQRETLIIKPPANAQTTAQQIPIDVDLSRLTLPTPRPAAGRPVPFAKRLLARLDQRQLTIAAGFLIAMVSALIGFIAGRL